MLFRTAALCALLTSFTAFSAPAQSLQGSELVSALRRGGCVIVMRHASSPAAVPDKAAANPDNTKPERQLDENGRATAAAMGQALRELKIPVGTVLSSPAYRALETVRYAQFPAARPVAELGDNGQSMSGGTAAQAEWLRKQVTQFPTGTNTVLVTHLPNLTGAFADLAAGMGDGEALIFANDGKGGARAVARVKIGEWARLQP